MTYCLAIALEEGLVFAADSRTNAGVDYVTTYGKMHVFQPSADRVFVLLSAGSLATSQEVLHRLRRDLDDARATKNLATVPHLFDAAAHVGRHSREVQEKHLPAMTRSGFNGEASFILGGQIRGQPPGLYLVYPQGNCISASAQTPYLQIGETKYGKPILDRVSRRRMTLADAVLARDALHLGQRLSLKPSDHIFRQVQKRWQEGLERALTRLPRFDWERDG